MAEYKIVYRCAVDRAGSGIVDWRPLCPVFVEAVQVVRRKGDSVTYLQARLMNVSQRAVTNVRASATVSLHDGRDLVVDVGQLDWDCAPGGSKPLKAVEVEPGDVDKVRLDILSVRFEDGGEWTAPDEGCTPLALTPLRFSPVAQEERELQLRDHGVRYRDGGPVTGPWKVVEGDGWWICSCGQPNMGGDVCCMCQTPKSTWAALQNQELLEKAAAQRVERERRDEAEKEAEKERRRLKKVREAKMWTRGAIIALVLAVGFLFVWQAVKSVTAKQASERAEAQVGPLLDEAADYIADGKVSKAVVSIEGFAKENSDNNDVLNSLGVALVDRAQSEVDGGNLKMAKVYLDGLANTPFWNDEAVHSAVVAIRNSPTDPEVYEENLPAISRAVKGVST